MTIGKKLYGTFAIVLILMIVVGLIGIQKMNTINGKTTEITTSWMPGVESINALNYLTNHIRSVEMQVLIEPDPVQVASLLQTEQADIAQLTQTMDAYQKTIILPEDQKNFNDFKTAWTEYYTDDQQFQTLAKSVDIVKGAGTHKQDVLDLIVKSKASMVVMQAAIKKEVALNHNGADAASKAATQMYQSGVITLVILIIIAIILAIVIAFIITRSITKALASMSQTAERIANGDLTVEELKIKSKDEIGHLATMLNQMVRNLKQLIAQILEASQNVSAAAQEISATTEELSAGAGNQAQSTQRMSELFGEFVSAINSVAQSAEQAAELSSQTSQRMVIV